jgi:Leucine-rich repeat (LRR) protein
LYLYENPQDNHLQNLPATLGQLKSLNWLNLSNNDLKTLPSSVGYTIGSPALG